MTSEKIGSRSKLGGWLPRTRNRDGRRTPDPLPRTGEHLRVPALAAGRPPWPGCTPPCSTTTPQPWPGADRARIPAHLSVEGASVPRVARRAAVDGDPLTTPAARDWAVRDYRTHLQAVAKRAPRTVNNALAAVDDFYTRRGLGAANATRADLPKSAPRALGRRTAVRFLRAVEQRPSTRDQALALIPFYAVARIAETVGLDVDDVKISARKGTLRILGKGEKVREVPLHPALRAVLADWLAERGDWPGAHGAALFLNQRGGRSRPAAPATSSPPSPPMPTSTAKASLPTPYATPSSPHSSAEAPTW